MAVAHPTPAKLINCLISWVRFVTDRSTIRAFLHRAQYIEKSHCGLDARDQAPNSDGVRNEFPHCKFKLNEHVEQAACAGFADIPLGEMFLDILTL